MINTHLALLYDDSELLEETNIDKGQDRGNSHISILKETQNYMNTHKYGT